MKWIAIIGVPLVVLWLVAVLLLCAVAGAAWLLSDGEAGPDAPDVAATPSRELRDLVLPIRTALAGQRDKAAALARYYADVADSLERDGGEMLPTTLEFARAFRNGLTLLGKQRGWPVDVGELLDETVGSYLGLSKDDKGEWVPVPLDPEKRAKLIQILKAIAWACEGCE